MTDRMQVFRKKELEQIHEASMEILRSVGVQFSSSRALDLFRRHGFRIEGSCVFFTEKAIAEALRTIPSRFTVSARNPECTVSIGEDDFVFLPTGGAPTSPP